MQTAFESSYPFWIQMYTDSRDTSKKRIEAGVVRHILA